MTRADPFVDEGITARTHVRGTNCSRQRHPAFCSSRKVGICEETRIPHPAYTRILRRSWGRRSFLASIAKTRGNHATPPHAPSGSFADFSGSKESVIISRARFLFEASVPSFRSDICFHKKMTAVDIDVTHVGIFKCIFFFFITFKFDRTYN